MIECPEYDYEYEKSHAVYFWFLHAATVASNLINPLIIYCIIYRSPGNMTTYRWFLLFHQVAAWIADIWISLFGQAVVLIPFCAGYVIGYAKYFMSPITTYACGHTLVVFEQITVILLFFYRYQTVHNVKTFTHSSKCFVAFLAVLQIVNTCLPFTIDTTTTKEIFKQLAKEYSCITPRLQQIPGIGAYDKMEVVIKGVGWILLDVVIFIFVIVYLGIGSWRATQSRNMSPKLRHMQQKFLIQLCVQSAVPILVVIGPIVLLAIIIIFDIFGYPWISDVVLCSCSLFSIISAVTLFIMNPTYHTWLTKSLTRLVRKKKT